MLSTEKLPVTSVESLWLGAVVPGCRIQDSIGDFRVDKTAQDGGGARQLMVELVTRAEAIIEVLEATAADGRWALTAFSRYRLCELLEIMPYVRYDGELDADPAALLDAAAQVAQQIDVPIEDLSWRLALGDALRTTAADIRRVRDADQ